MRAGIPDRSLKVSIGSLHEYCETKARISLWSDKAETLQDKIDIECSD